MKQDGKLTNRMKDLFGTSICSKIFVFPAQLKAHPGSPNKDPSQTYFQFLGKISLCVSQRDLQTSVVMYYKMYPRCSKVALSLLLVLNVFCHCFSMHGKVLFNTLTIQCLVYYKAISQVQ